MFLDMTLENYFTCISTILFSVKNLMLVKALMANVSASPENSRTTRTVARCKSARTRAMGHWAKSGCQLHLAASKVQLYVDSNSTTFTAKWSKAFQFKPYSFMQATIQNP